MFRSGAAVGICADPRKILRGRWEEVLFLSFYPSMPYRDGRVLVFLGG